MPTSVSAVQENLHFLLNEMETHCQLVGLFFKTHSIELLSRIRARRGYVQTLREKMEKECALLLEQRKSGTAFYIRIEAMRSLTVALENMSVHFLECIEEGTLAQSYPHPSSQACHKLVLRIERGIRLVKVGTDKSQRRIGIKLGRRSQGLLDTYNDIQASTLAAKSTLSDAQLQAALLCNFGLKCVIKQLAVVGEALIKADLGQVVSLQNYDHLRHSVSTLNYSLNDLKVRRLALTRSGSAIAAISHKHDASKEVLAVYKEGDSKKIAEEVQGVQNWRNLDPNIVPNVLAHVAREGGTSALLIEHLSGKTLETLLLTEQRKDVAAALSVLFRTLETIWEATFTTEQANAKFMQQLSKRIMDSAKVHPEFFTPEHRICGQVIPSFKRLVSQVEKNELRWVAPFSVRIHGDFNVDNLIYDEGEERIYFIDLHRSCYLDYVQDLAVLMVSIYRLQVLSGSTRALMMDSAKHIYQFGRRFAKRHNDDFFELRLAAGLARSFATSTRFIFEKKLASRMHLRARYLLEKLAQMTPEQELDFKIPLKEMYFE